MKKLLLLSLMLAVHFTGIAQDTTVVENFNANFGGFQPGTISGFGVDRVAFFLSDDAQEGPLSLAERVSSNSWGAGFQIQFADTNGQDWSAYNQASFWAKSDIATVKNVHLEIFSAEDDEQWAFATNSDLTTDWTQTVMGLDQANFVEVAGAAGDGAIDFAHINKVNFIFLNNGDFNEVLCQVDNFQLFGADTVTVESFNSNIGGFQPGTISGFGVDRLNFFLTDEAFEGPLALRERVGSTSWGAGFQIQFAETGGQDWSADQNLAFHAKADISSLKTVHVELFSAEDEEQWAAPAAALTTDWSQFVVDLDTANFVEVAGVTGDGILDLSHITKMNFIILNNGDFNEVTVTIDEILRGNIEVVGIEPIDHAIAESFELRQNYPNPFNPATTIEFHLTQKGAVTLDIFDATGRRITTLVDDNLQPGSYQVTWDGTRADGQKVSSGIYFYRLQQEQRVQTQRMLLVK